MATDDNLSHKFRILNIRRRKGRSGRAHLLGVPQEIRSIIYEMVLVEPPLHLRAHKPGCPRINILAGAETPVCKSSLEEFERGYGRREDRDKYEACQRICHRRPGLTLLRVNKQIHHEALPLFLGSNAFCFVSVDAFNATFPKIPPAALALVRRLWITHDSAPRGYTYWAPEIFPTKRDEAVDGICRFPNLVELSLPSRLLPGNQNTRLLEMKSLRTLRANFLHYAGWWPRGSAFNVAEEVTYMFLTERIDLPDCFADDGHPGSTTCSACRTLLLDRLSLLRHGWDHDLGWMSSRGASLAARCSRAAFAQGHGGQVASPDGEPRVLNLRLEDGVFHDVTLLGLPRIDDTARERLPEADERRRRKAQASNARRIRSQPGGESALALAELDVGDDKQVRRSKSSSIVPEPREPSEERSKEEAAQQRVARLKELAEAERARGRKSGARARARVKKSAEEQRASKKAGRKRTGRDEMA